jgi:hypothetical protein
MLSFSVKLLFHLLTSARDSVMNLKRLSREHFLDGGKTGLWSVI